MFLGKLKMAKIKKSEEKTKLDRKEAEELVKKLSKEGMPPTKIGQTLKDTYGTPSVKAMGFKIKKITGREEIPEDLQNLLKKADTLKKHFSANKQDKVSERGLQITEAKIRKLAAYYRRKGLLPENWRY